MKKFISWLLAAAFIFSAYTASAEDVLYPNIDGIGGESIGFSVLKLALSKSGGDYNVKLSNADVNQERARALVEEGRLSVFDTGFQPTLEDRFDPIYLPIDRGILGWRLFIIHKENAGKFASVEGLKDLQKYSAGQGNGWGDIAILENAGLTVKTASKIPYLIKMVGGNRFDMFPLGANEVFTFLDKYRDGDANLMVEEKVTLVYPYGRFYFVKKGNEKLASAIRTGMEKALDDGSLQALLKDHKFFADAFNRANLSDRVRIDIDTPGLTDGFKSIEDKWWYRPE